MIYDNRVDSVSSIRLIRRRHIDNWSAAGDSVRRDYRDVASSSSSHSNSRRWRQSHPQLERPTQPVKVKKVQEPIAVNGFHLTATGRHLPYGITQCYLLPDTSERAPP